ncbi:hypothetical protein BDB01DRAFT_797508 [Pilobolus umbonatus]|nr:hypothetical protein BDB01DRAFT_797508 [Pilobolus umbonatus]
MTLKLDRSFYKKTRTNSIIKLVREQYLRTDISCFAEQCSRCSHKGHQVLLSATADHYIVPDISVIMRYLELFEQEEMTGMIASQTMLMHLQQHDKTKIYKKLRHILNDSRRKSVVFYNELFKETKVLRLPNESSSDRDWRALCQMGQWYHQHLNKKIILISEVYSGDQVMTMQAYISTYWPDHTLLNNLVKALADVTLEEDDGKIRIGKQVSAASPCGYVEYKPLNELEAGIKSNHYISGTIRCRKDNRDQAYVHHAKLDKDIIIMGNEHRNRAVHGDTVVVEILSENNWTTASNDIAYNASPAEDEYEEDRFNNENKSTQPTGRVVGILNRNWRPYVATIQEDSSELGGSIHLAIPLDPVIPKIRVRYHDVTLIENQRIVVRIDNWPISSQYPNGHFVRSLGPIHTLSTEISAILVEHSISVSQASQGFSEASLNEMPIDTPEMPWKPIEEELIERRDLRDLTVFSIDPPNCQDIDDALSVKELKNGHVELGVHIADVSYFVKENSMTDLEARSRGTTVYLADRRFDMLPTVLSERVCSLRHKVDRYAVSVIWTLDASYKITDTWFGRSVINSSCEMEYEQAQQLLDGKSVATGLNVTLSKKLKPYVTKLADVLRVMRDRRLNKGALELEGNEIKFKITDKQEITDIIPKDSLEIHGLVAEAMIMANSSVGKRIYEGFRDAAILRHHPPPTVHQFDRLIKAAESKGFFVDYSSNKTLAKSLAEITKGCKNDPEIARLLKTMATIAMNEAGYISSGHYSVPDYYHYGLALEFYTHFTSPIRRYADIIAHRQLLLCVEDPVAKRDQVKNKAILYRDNTVSDICDHLNMKSRESKFAQRDSTELFQSLYVLQHIQDGDTLIEKGIISEIRSNGFYVFIPKLGIKGPVYLKDRDGVPIVPLSLISGKAEQDDEVIPNCSVETNLPLNIQVTSANLSYPIQFSLFDHVRVSLKLRKSHAHQHMVYMTLIDLDHTSTKEVLLTQTEMRKAIEPINEEEAVKTKKKKKKNQVSMYEVLEKFRKMSIIETTNESLYDNKQI